MWIIPKTLLPVLNGALATPDFILDSAELSETCASSLLVKSRLIPVQIWLRKWKRGTWTRHLFGRILKPSHARHFEIAWTSYAPVIHVNHSVLPASEKEPKIHDIYGPTSLPGCEPSDPNSASLRTSRDISRLDSPTSLAIWKKQVTERRGAYSARLKSAQVTFANESLSSASWSTPEGMGGGKTSRGGARRNELLLSGQAQAVNWPTSTVHGDHNRKGVSVNSGDGLSTAAKNWPTPNTGQSPNGHGMRGGASRNGRQSGADLQNIARSWPTQASRDSKGTNSLTHCTETGTGRKHMNQLPNFVAHAFQTHRPDPQTSTAGEQFSKQRRHLNPRFVEWLMEIPIGWTDCDCVEMEWCPQLWPKPSQPCSAN